MGKELQKRKERRGNTLHVDVNRLKGKTVERGMTGEEMAKELGLTEIQNIRNFESLSQCKGTPPLPNFR